MPGESVQCYTVLPRDVGLKRQQKVARLAQRPEQPGRRPALSFTTSIWPPAATPLPGEFEVIAEAPLPRSKLSMSPV